MSTNKVKGQGQVLQYVCIVKQDAEFFDDKLMYVVDRK